MGSGRSRGSWRASLPGVQLALADHLDVTQVGRLCDSAKPGTATTRAKASPSRAGELQQGPGDSHCRTCGEDEIARREHKCSRSSVHAEVSPKAGGVWSGLMKATEQRPPTWPISVEGKRFLGV